MSSIVYPHHTQAPLRLTRRGRTVLSSLVIVVVAIIALAVLALQAPPAAAGDSAAAPLATVSVLPGDTLWSIAESLATGGDPRDVIVELKRLNQLTSSSITPGQQLSIPAKYSH